MEILPISIKLLLSAVLGGVIGLERELHERDDQKTHHPSIIGLRSFALITSLGAISGLLYEKYLIFSVIITIGLFASIIIYYIFDSIQTKDIGLTSEIAAIYSYVIGILIAIDLFPIQLTLSVVVVLILLLSRKEKIKTMIKDIKRDEINAFVGYAIVALVILPFLPNKTYSLSDLPILDGFLRVLPITLEKIANIEIINPYKMWLIVALITGIDVFGYALSRIIGSKKGFLLTSFVGGFVSSTATTIALARQSKNSSIIKKLVAAAILANLASFIQHAVIIAPLNNSFFIDYSPFILLLIASSSLVMLYFIFSKDKNSNQIDKSENEKQSIFNISSALKFTFLFLGVSITSKIALVVFGESGFLITSSLAAATGLDAVTVNVLDLVGKTITTDLGMLTLVIANAINLTSKSIYVFIYGNKDFAVKFSLSMLLIILASSVFLIL